MGYESILSHQTMLKDEIRTDGYRRALEKVVRKGDRVLDFGCGTGILSFFAARAGASFVFALDETNIVRLAKRIAEDNGFDNIFFYHDDHETFQLDAPVDVLVSEWMGSFVFHEWMLEPLVRLRDRWLKPGGVMVPRRISLKLGLITDASVIGDRDFFTAPYGIDYSVVREWPLYNVLSKTVRSDQVLSFVISLGELDMQCCPGTPPPLSGATTVEVDATIHGLAGWFDAELCEGISFGTGPFDPTTHWSRLVFPLADPLEVRAGTEVRASVIPYRRAEDQATFWQWSVEIDNRRIDMDDFVHQGWLRRELPMGRL